MEQVLFPNWMLFAGLFLFLKLYSPTRLYLDNISCLAIAVVLAMELEHSGFRLTATFEWVISIAIFAIVISVPYWVSGMTGSVIQQLLLLNEQSVQDKRFTDESEALSKMSSLVFFAYALDSGAVFRPIFDIINGHTGPSQEMSLEKLFFLITDSLGMVAIVTGKYIILFTIITIVCSYSDLFFKKMSFSQFIAPNIKAIAVILLLNFWMLQDQAYVFKRLLEKVGYE